MSSKMSEKSLLPSTTEVSPTLAKSSSSSKFFKGAAFTAVILYLAAPHFGAATGGFSSHAVKSTKPAEGCYQPSLLLPVENAATMEALEKVFATEDFLLESAERLGGAVRVETESFDNMGQVGVDPVWEKFAAFHSYLEKTFPKVYANLELSLVNTYGIVLEWKGSDASLKPLLLTGHQDVVPVLPSTVDAWVNPPYSGLYDGEFIWGRGSIDDKSGLIGIYQTLESILTHAPEWKPKRGIVVASGMDEEASGFHGAKTLAVFLEEKYGKDAFSLLVDEGGGYVDYGGVTIAAPATGEKGYMDVSIKVDTLGGHSSVPPEHTSIGLLSLFVAELEGNPHPSYLTRENPYFTLLSCAAEYAPLLPSKEAKLIKNALTCDKALKVLGEEQGKARETAPFVKTTQAVDLVSGGVKVNALPESAEAVVNHRINVASSVSLTEARIAKLLKPLIKKYNLTLTAFDDAIVSDSLSSGHVTLSHAWGKTPLEPAPITKTGKGVKAWEVLAGSIKASHGSRKGKKDGEHEIVVSPAIMTGNTDTKYYHSIASQVYRYGHLGPQDMYVSSGIHSVNEALRATAFVDEIRFFTYLIMNVDENDI